MERKWYKLVAIQHSAPKAMRHGAFVVYPDEAYGYVVAKGGKRYPIKLHTKFACGGSVLMDVDMPNKRVSYYVDADDFETCIVIDDTDYRGELKKYAAIIPNSSGAQSLKSLGMRTDIRRENSAC